MFFEFGWQGWLALSVLGAVLILLITERVAADIACLGGLAILLVAGAVDVRAGLAGFSNEGVLTVAALYVVAAGMYTSGAASILTGPLFSKVGGLRRAMARLMAPTAVSSGFLNNTPIVAILLPGTIKWARENGIDAKRILIPLSYAAILGGTFTLIGTSTNLVVDGLLRESGHPGLSFFAIAWVGVPVAAVGMLFLLVFGPYLLPRGQGEQEIFEEPNQFTIEVRVPPGSPHIGKSLAEIVVGELEGLAPVAIARDDAFVPAPGPNTTLQAGDRLVFSEPAAKILQLHRYAGFQRADGDSLTAEQARQSGQIVEAILSQDCPLIGSVVGDGSFRRHYGAAVVAVARQGEPVAPAEQAGWRLRAGDICLLEARDDFHRDHLGREVFVIGEYGAVEQDVGAPAIAASLIACAMVVTAATGVLSIFQAAAGAATLMVLLKLLSPTKARDSLDWLVLLTIAGAFGIAAALEQTGVAGAIAGSITAVGAGPWATLLLFYLLTSVLTESITNNAAAALMFPFGVTVAASLSVSPVPFAVAIMFAASASFATPLGYQTNLMVYGAGNYQFRDFLAIGLPMNLLVGITAVALIPLFFPF